MCWWWTYFNKDTHLHPACNCTTTGSLEPKYCAIDGRLRRDLDASFTAYLTVSNSLDNSNKGQATMRQALQKFTCVADLQGNPLGGSAHVVKHQKANPIKKRFVTPATKHLDGNEPLLDDSLTEDNTDLQESSFVVAVEAN